MVLGSHLNLLAMLSRLMHPLRHPIPAGLPSLCQRVGAADVVDGVLAGE